MLELNEKNWKSEVESSKIPVVVDFWASWCMPCKMMGPIFEETSKSFTGKLKFAKLSTEEEPDLAQEHQIRGIPCLIVFDKGKEVGRLVGLKPAEALKNELQGVLDSL